MMWGMSIACSEGWRRNAESKKHSGKCQLRLQLRFPLFIGMARSLDYVVLEVCSRLGGRAGRTYASRFRVAHRPDMAWNHHAVFHGR